MKATDLVTAEQMDQIPCWARVAFAVRCARRVQPLVAYRYDAPTSFSASVAHAIGLSERVPNSFPLIFSYRRRIANARDRIRVAVNDATDAGNVVPTVAGTVAMQAASAAMAALNQFAPRSQVAVSEARNAHNFAIHAFNRANLFKSAFANAIASRHDYQLLVALSTQENWNDDTPVRTQVLGPLWPYGVPEDWPVAPPPMDEQAVYVQLEFPDDATDEEIEAAVLEHQRQLDALYRSKGGPGLKVDTIQAWTPKECLEPIGGGS